MFRFELAPNLLCKRNYTMNVKPFQAYGLLIYYTLFNKALLHLFVIRITIVSNLFFKPKYFVISTCLP